MDPAIPGGVPTLQSSIYFQSIPYSVQTYQNGAVHNPYGFPVYNSSYPLQSGTAQPHVVGSALAEDSHLNMAPAMFSQPPNLVPPIMPPLLLGATSNVFTNLPQINRTLYDDISHSAPNFAEDTSASIAAPTPHEDVDNDDQHQQGGTVNNVRSDQVNIDKVDRSESQVVSQKSPSGALLTNLDGNLTCSSKLPSAHDSVRQTDNVENRTNHCAICQATFRSSKELFSHVIVHTEHMPYQCGLCGVAFFQIYLLSKHVSDFHSPKDPYKCGLCSLPFSLGADFVQHTKSCESRCNDNTISLTVKSLEEDDDIDTGAGLSDSADLEAGPSELVIENIFKKESSTIIIGKSSDFSMKKKCTKILMEDIDLSSVCTVIVEPSSAGGVRKKHLYKCKFCEKLCKDRGQLASHVRVHTEVRPYECSTCLMKFKQYGHLKDHLMRHTKERPYVCDRCAKSFPRSSHLAEHMRLRHSEDRLYHCQECGESFQTRREFSKHKRSHGRRPKYLCNVCFKRFFNVTDYERHCRCHTKEKQFECEVCHLTFALLANAKKHMKVHSQDKPHKCQVCSKAFHFSNDLKRHESTHQKKNPFPCSDCYKSFKSESSLKLHSKIHVQDVHNPDRPFQCDTCKKRYKLKWDLIRHEKTHLKTKPFPCPMCYKSFNSEAMLKKHSKVHLLIEFQENKETKSNPSKDTSNISNDEVDDIDKNS